MTEQVQTTLPGSESDADGPEALPEGEGTGEPQKSNKEARYRVERNEARGELATANARIEALLRSDIERVAGEHLSQGSDIFTMSGSDVSAFLNDQGHIDYDRVREDAKMILSERPGLRKQTPGYDPSQGLGGKPPAKAKPNWGALLKD